MSSSTPETSPPLALPAFVTKVVGDHAAAADPHGDRAYTDGKTWGAARIVDLTESVQDVVAGMIVQGANITVAYNDAAGVLTISGAAGGSTTGAVDPEGVRDVIGAALRSGPGVSITIDDGGDTITISGKQWPTYPTQTAAFAGLAAGEFADGSQIVIGP